MEFVSYKHFTQSVHPAIIWQPSTESKIQNSSKILISQMTQSCHAVRLMSSARCSRAEKQAHVGSAITNSVTAYSRCLTHYAFYNSYLAKYQKDLFAESKL